MRMILLSLLLALFAGRTAGQIVKPGAALAGTWELVKSPKQRRGGADVFGGRHVLVITQNESEIRMSVRESADAPKALAEFVYFADGRGEKNATGQSQAVSSVTKWDGGKLVTRSSQKLRFPTPLDHPNMIGDPYKGDFVITEKWELSKDGQRLTRTVSSILRVMPSDKPPTRSETKYVYSRAR